MWTTLAALAIAGGMLWMMMGGKASPKEAKQKVAEGALLLDVRSPEEFAQGHLGGAVNIPVQELESRLAEVSPARAKGVVVYCRSGARSARAKRMLEQAGFQGVHDLGAMWRWPQ